MVETLLFSIIVPVYKVENYIDQCVQSLINQTYPDIEIILVDDGSPDKCPELCDKYAKQDKRIQVIHQKNSGLSSARNAGLEKAKGDYVLFVDSDDYIALDTCEKLLPFIRMNCDVVIGDGISEGAKKKLSHGSMEIGKVCTGIEYLKAAYNLKKMPMSVCVYVYNRAFLQENQLYMKKGIFHEDEQFTPRVFIKARRVVESGNCFYHYMIREGSITTAKDMRKNAIDMYETCSELKEIFEKLEDFALKDLLVDSLVVKYLSLFQQGKLYQYGKEYYHKKFVWNNARMLKTRMKAFLYCISPYIYWNINNLSKRRDSWHIYDEDENNEQ